MKEKVFEIISAAIEELNEELEYEELENVTADTPIFGGESGIDSLSLVSLVVEVEASVNEAFDANVTLADEKAMSSRNSPYRNVASFTDFVLTRLGEDG
ncbi:MAG: hypothetical protein AB8G95_18730 [Anaerolineae bacterium]